MVATTMVAITTAVTVAKECVMKTLLLLALPLLLTACTAAPRNGVPLQAQAPGGPVNSSIGQSSIVGAAHRNYARQPNEVNSALWGGAVGAGIGQAVGHDTEGMAYGFGIGALGGYYGDFP